MLVTWIGARDMAIRRGRSRSSSPALSLVSSRTGSRVMNDNGLEEVENPPMDGYDEPELSEPLAEDYPLEEEAAAAEPEATEPEPESEPASVPELLAEIGWGARGSKKKMTLKEKRWRETLMSQAAQSPSAS